MWYHVGLVGIDVSEKHIASIIMMERIGEQRTALAVALVGAARRHIPGDSILQVYTLFLSGN
jgi:hypothetical protein